MEWYCHASASLHLLVVTNTLLDVDSLQVPVPVCCYCSESRERHRQRQVDAGEEPEQGPAGWRGTEAEASELMVYHTGILRNKRLLFTYV
jgi:hypothetical protein